MAGWCGYIALNWRRRLTRVLVRFATGSRRAPGWRRRAGVPSV